MADKKPFFTKSIFANIEIIAVLGIFSLYALEFAGIHTFSQLFEDETSQLSLLSFQAGSDFIEVPQITVILFVPTLVIVIVYFAFVRQRLRKRK